MRIHPCLDVLRFAAALALLVAGHVAAAADQPCKGPMAPFVCDRTDPADKSAESAAPAAAPVPVHKVVYHADFADPRRFASMLTNINNMMTVYDEQMADYDVRIVFVAHGIRFVTEDRLLDTPFAEDAELASRRAELLERLRSLQEVYDVKLELCGITREAAGLAEKKILPGVTLVRSGVVRIAELQSQGFAYLKVQ